MALPVYRSRESDSISEFRTFPARPFALGLSFDTPTARAAAPAVPAKRPDLFATGLSSRLADGCALGFPFGNLSDTSAIDS